MQLYAKELNASVIHARFAQKKRDYTCLECDQPLRVRGGPHRQTHFYHIDPPLTCRQHQKGAAHIQVQLYFLKTLPSEDCQLEKPFPAIGRIADVAWVSRKIVFEIQYSPISLEEVIERNRDYESVGWHVVWILHDKRYNQYKLSPAERALRNSPHYFTNIDALGNGIIYDQFEVCDILYRHCRLEPLSVKINEKQTIEPIKSSLKAHRVREQHWKVSFSGDLIDAYRKNGSDDYWIQAKILEKKYDKQSKNNLFYLSRYLWELLVAKPYRIVFRLLLEKSCR